MMVIADELRSGRPVNVDEMAGRFEVNRKTTLRDLWFLRDRMRYDVAYCKKSNGWILKTEAPLARL
jgi:hypothetical protein